MDFLNQPLISDATPPWFLEELRAFANRSDPLKANVRRTAMMHALEAAQSNAQKLWKAGVLVVAGTDAPYPGDFQGEGIHHELELLVEAGLTPIEAITAATRNASQLMNATADSGTLEPGRLANVLVINGRPDQNFQDTHNLDMVIKEGVLLDRQQLKFNAARSRFSDVLSSEFGNWRVLNSAEGRPAQVLKAMADSEAIGLFRSQFLSERVVSAKLKGEMRPPCDAV